jgi:hypothetical protein
LKKYFSLNNIKKYRKIHKIILKKSLYIKQTILVKYNSEQLKRFHCTFSLCPINDESAHDIRYIKSTAGVLRGMGLHIYLCVHLFSEGAAEVERERERERERRRDRDLPVQIDPYL